MSRTKVFNRELRTTTTMENRDTTSTMEMSDFIVVEQPKLDHMDTTDPDPWLMLSSSSFRPTANINRAKLTEAWLMIKPSLEELGCSCTMSTVDSTVSVISPEPDITRKTDYLFKLLFKTPVSAPLAIEMALHGRQHDCIKLGTQKGGLCKRYKMKEKFDKLWRRLRHSLKELEDLTHCTLFLNKSTLTAVGPSPRLPWVRKVLKFCFVEKLSPAHIIRVFNWKLKRAMKKSDSVDVLELPKNDHEVSDPIPMTEESDFVVVELPKSNQEDRDPVQMLNSRSFRPKYETNRAKLREAWPMLKSSLEELGFTCTMKTVDSTVSLVLPSTDIDIMRKADYLFELLLKATVPAPLAIEMALQGRQHDLINLTPKSGICKKIGIKKKKTDELRRRLKRSLKELENLTHCTLFLNKINLTAVGPSPRLGWVRRVLEICITKKLSPRHVISAFICKYDQRISFAVDLDVPNVETTGHSVNKDGSAEVTLPFLERRATMLEGSLSLVESSLEKYGIACTLNLINCTVTISTTEAIIEYPDAFEKARHLLRLLTTSAVPPSLAIDLALNGKQHEFIEIGFQEGGLCSLYGIKKEQYRKRLIWLTRSVKGITKLTGCAIYCSVSGETITAVSPNAEGLSSFRRVVLACIVEDVDPAYLVRKESTWKLKKSIKRLLESSGQCQQR